MRDFSSDWSALALNTATLGHNLDGYGAGWETTRVIDACAERGFGGIVFWRREIGNSAVALGERVRANGMQVAGLCRSPFLCGPLAPRRADDISSDFRSAIEMAAELGAPVLTIVTGGVEPGYRGLTDSLKIVAEHVSKAAEYAQQCNVKLALEPLHPVYAGNRSCLVTVRDALDLCARVGHHNVGIALDVYHVWWDTTLTQELSRIDSQQLLGFHLCDWLADTDDVLLDRGMMGDGVADIRALRQTVEQAGYLGFCEVEIFSAANWWKKPPELVLDTCVERFRSIC